MIPTKTQGKEPNTGAANALHQWVREGDDVRTPRDWEKYVDKETAASELRKVADLIEKGAARMVKWHVTISCWHTDEAGGVTHSMGKKYATGKTGRIE